MTVQFKGIMQLFLEKEFEPFKAELLDLDNPLLFLAWVEATHPEHLMIVVQKLTTVLLKGDLYFMENIS